MAQTMVHGSRRQGILSCQIVAMDFPTFMLSDRPCCRVDFRYTSRVGPHTIDDIEETCLRISTDSIACGYIGLTTRPPVSRFHCMDERDNADANANHFPRWRAMYVIMVAGRLVMRSTEDIMI